MHNIMKIEPITLDQGQVAILDYSIGVVYFESLPLHVETSEEIEIFLEEKGYDVNNIHFMSR